MNAVTQKIDPVVAEDLARLALDLSHNKETRKAFGQLVRKAKPDSPHARAFSDLDVEDKFEAFKGDLEKDKIEAQREKLLQRMNAQRNKLIVGDESGRKYSEDDVKKIEALMEKKGITDYEDGAILYAATLPPESPKPSEIPKHGATWEFPELETFGKDPQGASRDIAHQVIGEFMRKNR